MVLLTEQVGIRVPHQNVPFFALTDKPTARIGKDTSLQREFMWENFGPNTTGLLDIGSHTWAKVEVAAGYTAEGNHFMLLPREVDKRHPRFLPTPAYIPTSEGASAMYASGIMAEHVQSDIQDGYVRTGYNSSHRSMDAGGQSVFTFHHHMWGEEMPPYSINVAELNGATRAIIGETLKRAGAYYLMKPALQEFGHLLQQDQLQIDPRGIRVPFKAKTVADVLTHPDYFPFMQQTSSRYDRQTAAITEAFTDRDGRVIDAAMQKAFIGGKKDDIQDAVTMLQRVPRLRSIQDRDQRLSDLRSEIGYPLMKILRTINPFLVEREGVNEESWVRNGIGHAWVVSQRVKDGKPVDAPFLRWTPLIRPIGDGVVEANGIYLTRPAEPASSDALAKRKAAIQSLNEKIKSSVSNFRIVG